MGLISQVAEISFNIKRIMKKGNNERLGKIRDVNCDTSKDEEEEKCIILNFREMYSECVSSEFGSD
jgi:hypothetical protein